MKEIFKTIIVKSGILHYACKSNNRFALSLILARFRVFSIHIPGQGLNIQCQTKLQKNIRIAYRRSIKSVFVWPSIRTELLKTNTISPSNLYIYGQALVYVSNLYACMFRCMLSMQPVRRKCSAMHSNVSITIYFVG